MDELTLIRALRSDEANPSMSELARGKSALESRLAESLETGRDVKDHPFRAFPTIRNGAIGLAAVTALVVLLGSLNLGAQAAAADDVLREASTNAIQYSDLLPGDGQYLMSRTSGQWPSCLATEDEREMTCEPTEHVSEVYMPGDPAADWVLVTYRDEGDAEVRTGRGGNFYGTAALDVNEIPTDAGLAYRWIDQQYSGGSASRAEDNFDRIASILRTGLVPGAQRAALLGALSRIPGVTVSEGVENFNGVAGVAIGRDEPVRFGQREELIVDVSNGMIIGERTITGSTFFGWGKNEVFSLSAIETSVVDSAPTADE